jgi:hypothetical protein
VPDRATVLQVIGKQVGGWRETGRDLDIGVPEELDADGPIRAADSAMPTPDAEGLGLVCHFRCLSPVPGNDDPHGANLAADPAA